MKSFGWNLGLTQKIPTPDNAYCVRASIKDFVPSLRLKLVDLFVIDVVYSVNDYLWRFIGFVFRNYWIQNVISWVFINVA